MYIEGLFDTVKNWVDAHENELNALHEEWEAQPMDELIRDILNHGLREEIAIMDFMEANRC